MSGLSQGIPAIATSWNHKYSELMDEYNLSNNILDVLDYEKSISIIKNNYNNLESIAKKITIKSEYQKILSTKMWEFIDKRLAI